MRLTVPRKARRRARAPALLLALLAAPGAALWLLPSPASAQALPVVPTEKLSGARAAPNAPAQTASWRLAEGDLAQPLLHEKAAPKTREVRKSHAPTMDKAEAAEIARSRHGGRVLAVHWTGTHYRVKLLSDGEMRIVIVEE